MQTVTRHQTHRPLSSDEQTPPTVKASRLQLMRIASDLGPGRGTETQQAPSGVFEDQPSVADQYCLSDLCSVGCAESVSRCPVDGYGCGVGKHKLAGGDGDVVACLRGVAQHLIDSGGYAARRRSGPLPGSHNGYRQDGQ